MNCFKKFIILLVTSSIILLNTVPVNADVRIPTPQEELQFYRDLYNEAVTEGGYQSWLKRLSKKVFDNVGFLIDESGILIQKIKDAIHGADPNMPADMTDEDAYDWVKSNLSVSDNIIANDSFNTFIKNYNNTYVNENPCYCYSYSINQMRNAFRSVAQLSGAEDLLKNDIVNGSPVEIWNFVKGSNSSGSDDWMQCLNVSDYPYLIWRDDSAFTQTNVIRHVTPYDGYTSTVINQVSKAYRWNSSTSTWDLQSATSLNPNSDRYMQINPTDGLSSNVSFRSNIWINSSVCQYRYLPNGSTITVDKVLNQPYYYNNDVWQDFSSTSGDYTFSPSNINTVTYGDTISYIDSFNNTEGYPPSPEQISINIKNENNNNTGGGGSGGDDSGGGSGSDSPSDIFGWLKQLGAVIGSLIKGVGEFLTEIVTGLVSAINSLLSGISNLIQNITESLPTVFMDFLGTLFSWLPDEWVALFSACIIFMLLWGIIKTIRGS